METTDFIYILYQGDILVCEGHIERTTVVVPHLLLK